MDEDIYSLAFVSMLSDECITPYFDVITGELINLGDSDSEEEEKPHSEQKLPLAQHKNKVNKGEEKQDEFTLEL